MLVPPRLGGACIHVPSAHPACTYPRPAPNPAPPPARPPARPPLCPSMRMGWARCQEGKVLVEKRECTRAM